MTVLLWLFPLSFAYAVVKHRVLEIPVLLRRSARYLLVQRGFVILLAMLRTVVAQPSRVESLGPAMLEAWASAKPVLAADIEVSRRLVEGSEAGVVVPFGDSAALAREIKKLLDDPRLCREMGLRGQKAALAYDGSTLWPRNAEVFERAAAEHRH